MNLLALALLLLPSEASAAKKSSGTKNLPAAVLKLAAGWTSLRAGQTAAASKFGMQVSEDSGYGDLGLWLVSEASLQGAQVALRKKKATDARKLAERAKASVAKIESRQPYFSLIREVPRAMGLAELVLCETQALEKSWARARRSCEAGFQRLVGGGYLAYLPRSALVSYQSACKKLPSPSDDTSSCSAWIQRLIGLYPKRSSEFLSVSIGREAELEIASASKSIAARTTQAYKSVDLDQAAFDEAFTLVLSRQHREGIDKLSKFITDFPKSAYRYRARYWLGVAFQRKGENELATQAFTALAADAPLTFYGLIAANLVSVPLAPDKLAPQERQRDPQLLASELFHLNRAEKLLAGKARDAAAIELRAFSNREPLSSDFLMYLARLQSEAGNHPQAFVFLGELIQRRHEHIFSQKTLSLIFPTEMEPIIKKIALEENVDPILALSLIKQESGFDAHANSASGALGLSQLMHATALDLDPLVERPQLLESERNLRLGIRYLGKLIARFKGNVILAIAAYNAGPGATNRWVRELSHDRQWLEFVELIPYRETREYVTSVLRNIHWYSKILGAPAITSFDSFWVQPASPAPVASPSASVEGE